MPQPPRSIRRPTRASRATHAAPRLGRLALAASLGLGLIAGPAFAATSTWNCADGKWETAACWSPSGVPATGSDIVVPLVGSASTWLRFDATTGSRSANTVSINSSASTFATLAMGGGTLGWTSYFDVGNTSTGRVQQTAGTMSGYMLRVGTSAGASGSYTLSGGNVTLSGWAVVGYAGQGSFTQTAGTLTSGNIDIGAANGSSGLYSLSGTGAIEAGTMWAAENGTAAFTQTGTSTVTLDNLRMGGPLQQSGTTSSYTLGGGTLGVGSALSVGYQGAGSASFAQSGGTVNGAAVFVGHGSNGSYVLSGGTLNASSYTGVGWTGQGVFTQTGGTHTTPDLLLAQYAGSSGAYYLQGGTLNAGSLQRGAGTSSFGWTGGTLNVADPVNVTAAGFFGDRLTVGAGKTLISGGALVVAADGRLEQSGGGVISATRLDNTGQVIIEGSTLALNTLTASTNYGTMSFAGGVLAGASFALASPLVNHGTITGNGTLGGGAFTNLGVLRPSGGQLLLSTNAASNNYGSIVLDAGSRLRVVTILANHGVIEFNGGTLENAGGSGVLSNESDGAFVGHGSLLGPLGTNRGLISVSGGMLSVGSAMSNAGPIALNGNGTGLIGTVTITNTGTLQGAGYVANPVANSGGTIEASGGTLTLAGSGNTNSSLGVISVGSGAKLLATGGLASNAALIQLDGGSFDNAGRAMANPGRIVGHGTLRTGGLSNNGSLSLSFGDSQIAGSIATLPSGLVVVSNGARATFADPLINNGELRVSAGGAANFFGLVSGGGAFNGDGEVRFEGGFSPGASPALVVVNFLATYGPSSTILMELGGTTPGNCDTCADKIVFTKMVTLQGGPLEVVWWGGHVGQAGEVFDLFDFDGGLTGGFGELRLPALGADLAWQTGHLYDRGEIGVIAVPEPRSAAMWLGGLAILLWWLPRRRAPAAR